MGAAKIFSMIVALLGLLVLVYFVFVRSDENTIVAGYEEISKSETVTRRADDPEYFQELRALTAMLKTVEDELSRQNTNALKRENELNHKIARLNNELEKANRDNNNQELATIKSEVDSLQKQRTETEQTNSRLNNELEQLRSKLSSEIENKNNQIEELKKQVEMASVSAVKIIEDVKEQADNRINDIKNTIKPEAVNKSNSETTNSNEVNPSATDSENVNLRPYQIIGGDIQSNNNELELPNLFNLNSQSKNPFGGVADNATIQNEPKPVQAITLFPVYTLPATTMLTDSKLLTPLVGRVPIENNVNDPFKFQIELGAENLAANNHKIPGVEKAIVAGVAIGNRDQSCVRGVINVITFIFQDGTIHTVGDNSGEGGRATGGLGYLADPYGTPCIYGTYINNAAQYLSGQIAAAFLAGMADAYGNSQITYDNDDGDYFSYVASGDSFKYMLGSGASETANTIAEYVSQRAAGAYDVVYVPQAQKVQIIIEKQVDIDYDVNGRKTSYLNSNRGVTYD